MNNKEFMDILNILSFLISIENLNSNLDQDTMQQILEKTVEDIHKHLEEQDAKIDLILKRLEDLK